MRKQALSLAALALLVIVVFAVWQWKLDFSWLEAWIENHALLGAAAYVTVVALSVVLLPFSSLPLLPLATRTYGVWLTGVLSSAGWWIGCLIAFQIARLGRRYLERVTSLESVDRLERKVPKDVSFSGIVILRMIFPVDLVSYALGLLKGLRFSTYAIASLVGIIPFAFVWSYAGGELGQGEFLSFALVGTSMIVAVLVVRRLWQRSRASR